MAKGLAHEIVADFKRVVEKLGRTPSRNEFLIESPFSQYSIRETFGTYTALVQAAGAWERGTKKQNKQEIRKEAFEHLKKEVEEKRTLIAPPKLTSRTLIIGDTHFPYTHPDAVQWLIALNRKYNFDLVIHIGDEVDFHAMSFHDHDPDLLSAGYELDAAIKMLEPLYKEFPNVMVAESNHGSMAFRKAKHHGFPRQLLKPYREAICAPIGWTWHDKIRFQSSNGQMNLVVHSLGGNVEAVAKGRGMTVFQGHHHEKFGSVAFFNDEKQTMMFGVQTGCLIDNYSYAFAYNKTNAFCPIMGSYACFNGTPHHLPMYLDKNGRWNGVVP